VSVAQLFKKTSKSVIKGKLLVITLQKLQKKLQTKLSSHYDNRYYFLTSVAHH